MTTKGGDFSEGSESVGCGMGRQDRLRLRLRVSWALVVQGGYSAEFAKSIMMDALALALLPLEVTVDRCHQGG